MENQILQSSASATTINLDDYFVQKRLEMMIESSTKKLANEIINLNSAYSKLSSEVLDLKRQLEDIRLRPSEPRMQEIRPIAESRQEYDRRPSETKVVFCGGVTPDQVHQGTSRNNEPIKPRTGDYTSEDVSVEKFFYFGGGKRK